MSLQDHVLYGLAWLAFGFFHSLLAHPPVRAMMGRMVGAGTRLAYNLFAVLSLAGVWLVGRWLGGDVQPFILPAWLSALCWALSSAGLLIGIVALRDYDLARFGGTWQLRNKVAPGDSSEVEPLVTRGLHRYVRHPLYSALFLVIWGLARDELALASAVWISLYLVIGTASEERKLCALYGQAYRDYRARVPAFLPWKGRTSA